MILHFLHGFLGSPSDWDIFKKDFFPNQSIAYSIENFFPSSHEYQSQEEKNYFKIWAKNFNHSIFSHSNKEKNILIGYSLGGRLALHCLSEKNQWDAAIIISPNPGLSKENEKCARIKNDEHWAYRFMNEPWVEVMDAWNAQGVFSNQKNSLIRDETQYDRKKISEMLVMFSLGKQKDLRSIIKNLSIPILWISGELDTKFVAIGKEISNINDNIKNVIIPNAGHRVPWENPKAFKKICFNFLIRGC